MREGYEYGDIQKGLEEHDWSKTKKSASEKGGNGFSGGVQQSVVLWVVSKKGWWRNHNFSCWRTQGGMSVTKLIAPHGSNHSTLNERDLMLMYCIQNNVQVD